MGSSLLQSTEKNDFESELKGQISSFFEHVSKHIIQDSFDDKLVTVEDISRESSNDIEVETISDSTLVLNTSRLR